MDIATEQSLGLDAKCGRNAARRVTAFNDIRLELMSGRFAFQRVGNGVG